MKKKRAARLIWISASTIVALAMIAAGYVWYSVDRTMNAMYEPLPSFDFVQPAFDREMPDTAGENGVPAVGEEEGLPDSDGGQSDLVLSAAQTGDAESGISEIDPATLKKLRHPDTGKLDPFAVLLLGVDERPGDRGRSDTMILLAIQPARNAVTAISIPRDTRVLLPRKEVYDKINHAYAFGGTALSVEAVERLFGIPIAYYMKTNMEGLVDIVDTVGGVDVDNPRAFGFDGHVFPAGEQHLNGTQALSFVRMRKEDPQGDFGRTQRQRQVLSSAVDRIASLKTVGKFPRLMSQLSADVRTNLTSKEILDLALDYRPAVQQVETLYLQGKGKLIDGIYYYTVRPEERQRIRDLLLNRLFAT